MSAGLFLLLAPLLLAWFVLYATVWLVVCAVLLIRQFVRKTERRRIDEARQQMANIPVPQSYYSNRR